MEGGGCITCSLQAARATPGTPSAAPAHLRVEAAQDAPERRREVRVQLALHAEAAVVGRVEVQHVELRGLRRGHRK